MPGVMVSGLPPVAAPLVAKILAQAGSDLASISGLTANAIAFANPGASQRQPRQPSRSKRSSTGLEPFIRQQE